MTPETLVDLFRQVTYTLISIVCVMIVPSLVTGLVVSIFQTVTQIQEQTLTFLPRFIVTMFMIVFAGDWMLREAIDLFNMIHALIPSMIS